MSDHPTPLVTTRWLAAHLGEPGIRILDASWYLPVSGRDAPAEFIAGHIPGAGFFDLDAMSNRGTNLPHMLPSDAQFARDAGALGIGNDTFVVVYDGSVGNLSAARAWWMFRTFGHDRVAVLDGGLRKWRSEGHPIEPGAGRVAPARFTARLRQGQVRSLDEMIKNLDTGREQVLDARSPGRFAGSEPEPRAGLRSGHLPDSRNLPYTELVGPDGTLLSVEELRKRFEQSGVDLAGPVVTTCGSGTSACALLLGLHVLGHRQNALYDGSWTEWGGRPDTPVKVD
jgi:thiosulfate/3-mercaptopyruvate sulfurtransferase